MNKIRFIMKDFHFSIKRKVSFILLLLSILIGTLLYSLTLEHLQGKLLKAYRNVDVICDVLSEEPSLAQGVCNEVVTVDKKASDSIFTQEVIYYLFKKAELFDPNDISEPNSVFSNTEMPETAFLAHIFMNENPAKSQFMKIKNSNTLELIAHIAIKLGKGSSCSGIDEQTYKPFFKEILARGMSGVSFKNQTPLQSMEVYICETQKENIDGFIVNIDENRLNDNDILSFLWTATKANNAEFNYDDNPEINQWAYPQKNLTNLPAIKPVNGFLTYDDTDKYIEIDKVDKETIDQIYKTASDFSQYLMGKVHSNDQIALARKHMIILRGPEQLVMLCLLIFVILIMTTRFFYRIWLEKHLSNFEIDVVSKTEKVLKNNNVNENVLDIKKAENIQLECRKQALDVADLQIDMLTHKKYTRNIIYKTFMTVKEKLKNIQPDDVDQMRNALTVDTERIYNSRWIVRWAALTIPAIGFVGTVRGILQSLSQADIIVWAATKSERATAIGTISGELGLAFATTLIALLIGIFVSVFNEQQSKSESDFVYRLEEVVSKFLDYRYQGRIINTHDSDE